MPAKLPLTQKELLRRCSEKQLKFYKLLIQSDKFDAANILKCFLDAGYANCENAKYNAKTLYYSPKIQSLLSIHREKTVEKIENRTLSVLESTDQDLIFIIKKAKNQTPPDLSTMRAAVMDRAKLHGILIDKHQVINPQAENILDENKRKAALKLAQKQLLNDVGNADKNDAAENTPMMSDDDNIIDADFADDDTDNIDDDDTQDIVSDIEQ